MKNEVKFAGLLAKITEWFSAQADIAAVALVGSYAREQAKLTSDIDLCILTEYPDKYLKNIHWAEQFGAIEKSAIEHYGKSTSLRVYYHNSFEVEFTFTTLDWAEIPIDPGTKQVLQGGFKILVDKTHLLANLFDQFARQQFRVQRYMEDLTRRCNLPESDSLYRSILVLRALLDVYPDWYFPYDGFHEVPESAPHIKSVLEDIKTRTNNYLCLPNAKQIHAEIKLNYGNLDFLSGCLSRFSCDFLEIDLPDLAISAAILCKDLDAIIKVIKQKYLNPQGWIDTERSYQIAQAMDENDWLLCPECSNAWPCEKNIPLAECGSCQSVYCNPYYLSDVGSTFNKKIAYAKTRYLKHDIQDANHIVLFVCFEHLLAIYTAMCLVTARYSASEQNAQLVEYLFTVIAVLASGIKHPLR